MANAVTDHTVKDIKELELGLRQTYKDLELQCTFLKSNLIDIKQSDLDPKAIPQIVKELEKTSGMCAECHQVTGQMVKKIAESLEYLQSIFDSVNKRSIVGRKRDSGISSMGTNPGSSAMADLELSTTECMEDILAERRASDPDITEQEETPANDTKDIVRQFSDTSDRTTSGELESEEDNTKASPETEDNPFVIQKIRNDSGHSQSGDESMIWLNNLSGDPAALQEVSAPAVTTGDDCVPILPPVLDEPRAKTTEATGSNTDTAPRESVVFATGYEDQREFLESQAAETHLRRTQSTKHHRQPHDL